MLYEHQRQTWQWDSRVQYGCLDSCNDRSWRRSSHVEQRCVRQNSKSVAALLAKTKLDAKIEYTSIDVILAY